MISLYITNFKGTNKTVSDLGNQVTVFFNPAINFDDKKKYHLRLLSANVVCCMPNVFAHKNDLYPTLIRVQNSHLLL